MNPHNTQKLWDAFPYLYRGRHLPASASAMPRGFECGDGWFGLVWDLSRQIESAARSEGRVPQSAGWPEATQVKNKLGTLRFHLRHGTDATRTLINQAQRLSHHMDDMPSPTSPKDGYAPN